ncbi:MAG: HEAT repeat domain-containing protein [Pirellulaceae bacterium]
MADVTVLAQQLHDKQVVVRARAAQQLSACGEAAREATIDLLEACGDDESVREGAVAALEQLGPPPADLLSQLSPLVGSSHELVAYWAVTLLGRLQCAATAAVPALIFALEHSPHLAVRQRAAWALGQINDRSAPTVAALERAKNASDPRLARLAAEAVDRGR